MRPARDPALPWLESALALDTAGPLVLSALAAVEPVPPHARLMTATLRRHKPGRRALVSYRLADPQSGWARSVLGKFRHNGLDTRTVSIVQQLSARDLGAPAGVPPFLGSIPEWHCWLQQEVGGRSGFLALASRDGPDAAFRIGAGLAWLHEQTVSTERRHTIDAELDALEQRYHTLETTAPDLASRIWGLYDALRSLGSDIEHRPEVGLHRDFYPDQVLVGHRVSLLDLDLYALGHAALDLGNFLAHLYEFDLRTARRHQPLRAMARSFLAGYDSIRPLPSAEDLARYELLSLARHVALSRVLVGREHTTLDLLDECHRRAEGLLCGRT